jgi:hypothetical protein
MEIILYFKNLSHISVQPTYIYREFFSLELYRMLLSHLTQSLLLSEPAPPPFLGSVLSCFHSLSLILNQTLMLLCKKKRQRNFSLKLKTSDHYRLALMGGKCTGANYINEIIK